MGVVVMGSKAMVVDGQHIVREGVACLLRRIDGVEGVVQAASGEEALKCAKEMDPPPELVIMDLRFEGVLQGFDLAAAMHQEIPEAGIVVLTDERHRGMVDAAMRAGASAFLLKTSRIEDFEQAIGAVNEGKTYVSAEVSRALDADMAAANHPVWKLSRRERQVLTLIARGGTTKSMAIELGISPKTVEKHRGKLSRKLDIRSVAALTRFAIENDLD